MAGPKTYQASLNGGPPGQAEYLAELQRQQMAEQQLAEAQAGSAPRPVDTGRFLALDFTGVANALTAKRAASEAELSKKRQADLQGEYQKGLVAELRKYKDAQMGTTRELPGPTPDGEPLIGKTPGNQRAFMDARSSRYPEVAALAKADEEQYNKRFDKAIDRASLSSIQASGGDLSALAPKDDYKVSDGSVWNTKEGEKPSVAAGFWNKGTLPSGATSITNDATGKIESVDKFPAPPNPNKLGDFVVETTMKTLPDKQKAAQSWATGLRSTETALDALAEGARSGYGEPFFQNMRTLINGITGLKFDNTASTGVLAKALAENTVAALGGSLGNQISNADRDFIATATGGTQDDPKALERILAIRSAALENQIRKYNSEVETLASTDRNNQEAVTRLYQVELPQVMNRFQSPEALASYISGVNNIPYAEALKIASLPANRPEPSERASGAVKTSIGVPTFDADKERRYQEWKRKQGIGQ